MFAEISNLYVADKEQVEKFGKISDALDATKKALAETAAGIDTTTKALDKSIAKSQEQFDAMMGGVRENLATATGGNSFVEFFVSPNIGSGFPPTYPMFVDVWGKHPMRHVIAQIQTLRDGDSPEEIQKQIQSIHAIQLPLSGETILPGPTLLSERLGPGKYSIGVDSINGSSSETLTLELNDHGMLDQSYEVWKDGKMRVQLKDGKLIRRRVPH
jgi:hypothetical protein